MSELNSKIPVGHIFPFKLFKNLKRIQKIKKTIKSRNTLGVKMDPVMLIVFSQKLKKLFILEISPRLGATCLPEMLKIYTDVDWDLNTIRLHNSLKTQRIEEKKNLCNV